MFGKRFRLVRWCKQNNWTELRQLDSGDWVAFPPGGVMETPLPAAIQSPVAANNTLISLASGFMLFVVAIAVAMLSILIAPLFIAVRIRKYKQRRSAFSARKEYDRQTYD